MPAMRCRFYTVDAFTNRAFEGAQIAVLPDARGLNESQMQKIAREFNVSETVFVLPALGANHARRLRMFTPFSEIPFGGHPTLAAAYVLTTIGDITADDPGVRAHADTLSFDFEENVGPVHISVTFDDQAQRRFCEFGLEASYSVDRFTPPDKELAAIFSLSPSDLGVEGFTPMVVATDMPYLVVPVNSFAAVRRAKFDYRAWVNSSAPASLTHQALLFSTETEFEDSSFHCRLLGPEIGVNEDPPIGSSVPSFAGYLCELAGPEHSFAAERGGGKFRRSLLHVRAEKRGQRSVAVRVGGTAVLISDGHIHL
jgi:trans-2,3-dihydro-3-hydroxyanthranilate isomerase